MTSNEMPLACAILTAILIHSSAASSLSAPPLSVVVVAFEDAYDLSLLANTISDLGIETTFIVPSNESDYYYEHMVDVDVIKLNASLEAGDGRDVKAAKLCKSLVADETLLRHFRGMLPTFVIFPGVRYVMHGRVVMIGD